MCDRLSIIVPVLNEAKNIPVLTARLQTALDGLDWEVVFVDDDSQDGSSEVLRALAREYPQQVRFITRIGRQGLSSAVIEGALSSSADVIAVLDGDLQHDETLLTEMWSLLRQDQTDIVVASRFMSGGSVGEFSTGRRTLSRIGNWLAQSVIKARLSDPLSGFFMLRRTLFDHVVHHLSGIGFKLLLDILAASKQPLRVKEVPFEFGVRLHGKSKIDSLVVLEFGLLLANKWFGRWIPVRFLLFCAVGGLGVGVHILLLGLLFQWMQVDFYFSQAVATLLTMGFNFSLNNLLTYRHQRLSGRAFVRGLLIFYLACSIGALANFQFAEFLYQQQFHWAVAGLAGAIIGAVWNYSMSSMFVWAKNR